MPSDNLSGYLDRFSEVEGFFKPLAMWTWDFLFSTQARGGVTGGMLEIGVFQGKSGLLSAMYMAPEEPAFFLDRHEMPEARKRIRSVKPDNIHFLKMNSVDALRDAALCAQRGALRWIHIDGEHTGYSAASDLNTAAFLLSENGVICVDDFFNFKYPQITAAVYQFLLSHPFSFKMFLTSENKCYICRSEALSMYDDSIRSRAVEDMKLAENDWTLTRTSYLHDFGCFSIIPRNKGRDFVGLDRNIDAKVF